MGLSDIEFDRYALLSNKKKITDNEMVELEELDSKSKGLNKSKQGKYVNVPGNEPFIPAENTPLEDRGYGEIKAVTPYQQFGQDVGRGAKLTIMGLGKPIIQPLAKLLNVKTPEPMTSGEKALTTGAEVVGSIPSMAMGSGVAKKLGGGLLATAAGGAVTGAMQPVQEGKELDIVERVKNAGAAATIAGAFFVGTRALELFRRVSDMIKNTATSEGKIEFWNTIKKGIKEVKKENQTLYGIVKDRAVERNSGIPKEADDIFEQINVQMEKNPSLSRWVKKSPKLNKFVKNPKLGQAMTVEELDGIIKQAGQPGVFPKSLDKGIGIIDDERAIADAMKKLQARLTEGLPELKEANVWYKKYRDGLDVVEPNLKDPKKVFKTLETNFDNNPIFQKEAKEFFSSNPDLYKQIGDYQKALQLYGVLKTLGYVSGGIATTAGIGTVLYNMLRGK